MISIKEDIEAEIKEILYALKRRYQKYDPYIDRNEKDIILTYYLFKPKGEKVEPYVVITIFPYDDYRDVYIFGQFIPLSPLYKSREKALEDFARKYKMYKEDTNYYSLNSPGNLSFYIKIIDNLFNTFKRVERMAKGKTVTGRKSL